MEEETNKKYKYRKWPLFIPVYILFALFYFFSVYSFKDLSYRTFAETLVMTIFVVTAPMFVYFDLKIAKIKKYKILGLDLLYSWLLSTAIIFVLMLTYLTGWSWFGAIALLFFLFCYNFFWLLFSLFSFKWKKIKAEKSGLK